jgi:hypothetical protein
MSIRIAILAVPAVAVISPVNVAERSLWTPEVTHCSIVAPTALGVGCVGAEEPALASAPDGLAPAAASMAPNTRAVVAERASGRVRARVVAGVALGVAVLCMAFP